MAVKLSILTKSNLEKCRASAIAAVDSYNRPGPQFRTALYVVLIVMAWQAYFHAYYYNRNRKPWYQSRKSKHKKGVRYERIDGEPKHWDLAMCLAKYFLLIHESSASALRTQRSSGEPEAVPYPRSRDVFPAKSSDFWQEQTSVRR